MKKLILIIGLICLVSCEKEYTYLEETQLYPSLKLYSDLSINVLDNDTIYNFYYPEGNNNSYFIINYNTLQYQRVFWESPDMFYTIMWQDTIWTPVVDYSTYADENGDGKQVIYINENSIGDTLNIIAKINNNNEKEIKVVIHPDCYPLLCNEEGYWY
tara:strand:+ start:520 stop:993 length:474 start_codon:yes stop_codon:yes gene_type:complete